jgi:CRP-like cAMP-binding protein
LYLIDSGKCIVFNSSFEQEVFDEIGRGDFFGES